jgi:hypothetical protein
MKKFLFIPALAMFALAQNPDPTTQKQHEERHSTVTRSSETTTTASPRNFSGKLLDAECAVLSSRWEPVSTSSSVTTAERRSSTSTEDQDRSAEGRAATDRTTTSTREEASRTETRSSADRTSQAALSATDMQACTVKSTTKQYALATPDGNVYRLSGDTLSSDISGNKKWSKKIANNDTKNMRVKVTGDLSGDTITVQKIK